tara:strand:- start:154 stop:486 length:333 start_codon:yes stop_codon:yes gene_type:complete
MKDQNNDLLSEAAACLSSLIESSYLDASGVSKDCLEYFDTYDWEPKENLNKQELVRWGVLLKKGNDNTMSGDELLEFVNLVDPESQSHTFLKLVHAKILVEKIRFAVPLG